MESLKQEFRELIDKGEVEQKYQEFLEKNTQFIPREFVQNHGIHNRLLIRKLPLGRDYTTDFFFLAKSSDDWNCVFIEIEKPYSRFFKDNSNEFHPDFQEGLQQINKWRGWLETPGNIGHFVNSTIAPLKQPMPNNPFYPKYVLVFGRRSEYANNETRKGLIRAQERDDFKIITYDSLLENTENNYKLYLSVRKNEFIEIHSNEVLGDNLFSYVEPEHLRLNKVLKASLVSKMEEKITELSVSGKPMDSFFAKTDQKLLDKVKSIATFD